MDLLSQSLLGVGSCNVLTSSVADSGACSSVRSVRLHSVIRQLGREIAVTELHSKKDPLKPEYIFLRFYLFMRDVGRGRRNRLMQSLMWDLIPGLQDHNLS